MHFSSMPHYLRARRAGSSVCLLNTQPAQEALEQQRRKSVTWRGHRPQEQDGEADLMGQATSRKVGWEWDAEPSKGHTQMGRVLVVRIESRGNAWLPATLHQHWEESFKPFRTRSPQTLAGTYIKHQLITIISASGGEGRRRKSPGPVTKQGYSKKPKTSPSNKTKMLSQGRVSLH